MTCISQKLTIVNNNRVEQCNVKDTVVQVSHTCMLWMSALYEDFERNIKEQCGNKTVKTTHVEVLK